MATIAQEITSDVTVFTTEENYEHATASMDDDAVNACQWVVKKADESFRSFFARVEQATAKLDVIWLITPYGPSEVVQEILAFSPQCPAVTLLHASSRFVPANQQLFSKVFARTVTLLSDYLPAPVRGRSWNQAGKYLAPHILNSYDCVLPLYPPVTEYVEQNVKPDAIVDWFLPEFHRPPTAVDHERLQITVPGRIKRSLRDYEVLFEILDELAAERDELTVCLLGRPVGEYGKQVIERCKRYERQGYNIQYYPDGDWISGEEFAHQMARTDLVFAPIVVRQKSWAFNRDRIKGQTATSGVIGDAVRIGRPLVMPEEFTVASEFEDLITTYEDSTDAAALIESWVASEATRQELHRGAERTARQFNLKRQAARFEQICQQAIDAS